MDGPQYENKPVPTSAVPGVGGAAGGAVGGPGGPATAAPPARPPPVPLPSHTPGMKLPLAIQFMIEVITGTFAFAVLGGAAGALSVYVDFLARQGVSEYVQLCLRGGEMLLLGSDIVLFTAFVFVEAWRMLRRMIEEARS